MGLADERTWGSGRRLRETADWKVTQGDVLQVGEHQSSDFLW